MAGQPEAGGKRAWELYLEDDVVDRRLVRPEVADSWKRCRELRVDPLQPATAGLEERELLRERLEQKARLMRVARPFIEDLSKLVTGTHFQVVLADQDGLLLESLGEPQVLARTREVNLCPGANWSEAAKGTNAIGTALADRRPVHIFAWEHYCEGNHFLTCSAAPIRDTLGNVIGVLDITGDSRDASPHTLAMVVAAARAIETKLELELSQQQVSTLSRYSDMLARGMSDGLLAIDRDGFITHVNARGGELLGLSPAEAKGAAVSEVCRGQTTLVTFFETCQENDHEELIFDCHGRKVRASAAALRDDRGTVFGAIALLREVSSRSPDRRPGLTRGRPSSFDDIVGTSPAISAAKEYARQAAASSSTVLVLGESGSGKELFVNAIHDTSARSTKPLVAINCASLPETLIESELFGYVDGSFTGARKGGQVGKFELANGGTLFLDEIGDMSPAVQAKLLRVLQERRVARIGSAQEIPLDIRLIAATHRDLRAEAEGGRFRLDLYYRLAVLEIVVPPLRDRLEDIPLLTERLAAKVAARLGRGPVRIEVGFIDKLCAYSWPGNVRELENVIERSINRAGNAGVLGAALVELPGQRPAAPAPRPSAPTTTTEGSAPCLKDVERQAIVEALAACGGNILRTAAKLGIGRNTLYRKLERYHLSHSGATRPADEGEPEER